MFSKHLIHLASVAVLAIASGVAFATLFARLTVPYTPLQPISTEKNTPQKQPTGPLFQSTLRRQQDSLADFQFTDFHRTIVDNNLFRPLGWTPPRPQEPYRLLGTLIARDADTPARAILQGTNARTTHIVTVGETLNTDTLVVDIQPKQVTLEKDGHQRTLHLNTIPLIK